MKKEPSLLPSIAILIYVLTSLVDRFILKMPDYVYLSIMVIAILMMVIGIVQNKKSKDTK